jgi:capsular polysaccharide biosynthesis protein
MVAYPLFNKAYEEEILDLLCIRSGMLMDSRYSDISANKVVLANSGSWFYPNSSDISSLKRHIENKLAIKKTASNRIYISRSCRRQVNNENELITMLKTFDFIIIEDKQRSVAEQVEIYKNASFIIGPHGASFTNIIWCEPGTHLFELFSPNYFPDFFLYLSNLMNMKYSAYINLDNEKANGKMPIEDNISVSITDLEKSLNEIFSEVVVR